MSGFVGSCSLKNDVSNEKNIIKNMNLIIKKTNDEKESYLLSNNINLGQIKQKKEDEPYSVKFSDTTYTIVYNGRIYNKEEVINELSNRGYFFNTNSDTEIILKAYMEFNEKILHKLNGVFSFAIWNDKKEELFLARDHFGIKPLYYTIKDNQIIFGSEIKAILSHPKV